MLAVYQVIKVGLTNTICNIQYNITAVCHSARLTNTYI